MESRGKMNLLRTIGMLTLLMVLALGMFQGCMYASQTLAFSADFSKHPPEQVFQMAMGYPPPQGVSEMRVSGRHYLIKRWVWMRFRVTDEAMHTLIEDRVPFPIADARRRMAQTSSAHPRYDKLDQERIDWNAIRRIEKPEVYEFSNLGGWIWIGYLIVDRKNNLVWVHAWGD